jgi:hypothetical protein
MRVETISEDQRRESARRCDREANAQSYLHRTRWRRRARRTRRVFEGIALLIWKLTCPE